MLPLQPGFLQIFRTQPGMLINRQIGIAALAVVLGFGGGFVTRGVVAVDRPPTSAELQAAAAAEEWPVDWVELDSAEVVELAKAAANSEFRNPDDPFRVHEFRKDRLGHFVDLAPAVPSIGGGVRVRVSNSGKACAVSFDQ